MDFDEVLNSLGGISNYQVIVICGSMLLAFASSTTTQLAIFFSAVPSHRCNIPFIDDAGHLTESEKENLAQLFIPSGESCVRYDYNITQCAGQKNYSCLNKTQMDVLDCDHGYFYDNDLYQETTVSKWDLVCDRAILDSVAVSVYFMGFLFGSAGSGFVMDLIGRKKTMLIFCIGLILAQLGCSFALSFGMYVIFRFLTSFFGISTFLSVFTYALEISNKDKRTLAGTMVGLMCGVAHTLLAGIAFMLQDWKKISIYSSLLGIPFLIVGSFLPNSPRWLISKGRIDDAIKVIKRFAKSLKRDLKDEDVKVNLLQKVDKPEPTQRRKTYADLFKPRHMRIITFIVMYDWFVVSMVFYGIILNVGNLAGNPYVNATINAALELAATPFLYWLLQKMGRRITTSGCYTLGGICCLLTMLLTHFSNGHNGMEQAARWIAISGKLFMSSAFGAIYQFTADLYPTEIRGKGLGLGSTSARIGSMITPFTLHLQSSVPWITQTIFGVLGVAAGLLSLILPETVSQGLLNTVEEGEDFYSRNMHWISRKQPDKQDKNELYEL